MDCGRASSECAQARPLGSLVIDHIKLSSQCGHEHKQLHCYTSNGETIFSVNLWWVKSDASDSNAVTQRIKIDFILMFER